MLYRIEKKLFVLEKSIHIACYNTGDGINVLIEGGDKGHIGAVAVIAPEIPLQIITLPGHREDVVCRKWAEQFWAHFHVPVVVEAGVHFDNIGKDEISQILESLETVLYQIIEEMEKEDV